MNDRQTGTNAADSAPGVNDGPALGRRADHMTRPKGRGGVFLWVALSVALLLVIFVARPFGSRGDEGAQVGMSATRGEIENSTVPGASDPSRPADAR